MTDGLLTVSSLWFILEAETCIKPKNNNDNEGGKQGMKRYLNGLRNAERGFTLIELLIVVCILGIIAAIAVPSVSAFMTAGTLNAANTELQDVRTAGIAYFADHDATDWPDTEADLTDYLTGAIKGEYSWDQTTGVITGDIGTWTGIQWDGDTSKFVKATS
jgi:prepilin-type N-terminal cleavage/methylation domain-containing protein